MATSMQAEQFQYELGVTVLKNILDSQERAGQAIVNMINNSPSLDGTGSIIDISV